jgi:vitamin-K-epoxide reductase (warfarin-sensitive)
MMTVVLIIALIGLAISIYGIKVEQSIRENNFYKPACDISSKISCSRPMLSEYNKMLGVSNIWISALYYCAIIASTFMELPMLPMILSIVGVAVSIAFAYILYFKIRSFCLICTSLYIINIVLMIACFFS